MTIETITSEQIYQGRAFSVRRDQVRLPNGRVTQLDIVEHVGAVTIIPLDEQKHILFVRQYRHAAGRFLLELPAGTLEKDEPPEECAHREIREETGMAAEQLQKIGEFFLAPGYSTEFMHIYLATELHSDPLPVDQDEILSLVPLDVEQAYQHIFDGEIKDAKSIAALLLARSWLL
jgi:nudix-type nucleoside diphosphatase (YffH/AdpP family)